MKGPSPVYPATPATPEFIEWYRKAVAMVLPHTVEIIKSGEAHVPAFFVYPMDDDTMPAIVPVPQFFSSTTGKDVVSLLHREMANDEIVKGVILLTEAWVRLDLSQQEKQAFMKDMKRKMRESLENDPQKQEAIVFNGMSRGMQLLSTYLIERPGNDLKTPAAIMIDPQAGVLEIDGEKADMPEGIMGSYGRMTVPPKRDA